MSEANISPPTFVDFDHTLLGANSTELFIAHCRPSVLVAVLEFVVRRCVPWKFLGLRHAHRVMDYICCMSIICTMPWNLIMWRGSAARFFESYKSPYVESLLGSVERVAIVSFGNALIIQPMLARSIWQNCPLIATPAFVKLSFFGKGKSELVRMHFNDKFISGARFITDSKDDQDLLDAVHNGILIAPQGEQMRASESLYLPLRYTFKAKYPTGYAIDQFLFVDSMLLMICTATDLHSLAWLALVAPLMTLSFMCIYEIGYLENDFVGATLEKDPTLSSSTWKYQTYPMQPSAWLWAVALGAVGVWLGQKVGLLYFGLYSDMLVWVAILLLTRGTFYIYNRQLPASRIYLYLVLQMEKSALVLLIIAPTVCGAILVASHIMTMWGIYVVYRLGSRHREIPKEAARAAVFAVTVGLLLVADPHMFRAESFSTILAASWLAVRILKQPLICQFKKLRASSRPAIRKPS